MPDPVQVFIAHPTSTGHIFPDPAAGPHKGTLLAFIDVVGSFIGEIDVKLLLPNGRVLSGSEVKIPHELPYTRTFEIKSIPCRRKCGLAGLLLVSVRDAVSNEVVKAERRVHCHPWPLIPLPVWPPPAPAGAGAFGPVTIDIASPAPDADVPDKFVAYGNADPSTAIMAAGCMPAAGPPGIQGQATTMAGYDWAFSFQLAAGTQYTLTVVGNAMGYTQGQQGESITSD